MCCVRAATWLRYPAQAKPPRDQMLFLRASLHLPILLLGEPAVGCFSRDSRGDEPNPVPRALCWGLQSFETPSAREIAQPAAGKSRDMFPQPWQRG